MRNLLFVQLVKGMSNLHDAVLHQSYDGLGDLQVGRGMGCVTGRQQLLATVNRNKQNLLMYQTKQNSGKDCNVELHLVVDLVHSIWKEQ